MYVAIAASLFTRSHLSYVYLCTFLLNSVSKLPYPVYCPCRFLLPFCTRKYAINNAQLFLGIVSKRCSGYPLIFAIDLRALNVFFVESYKLYPEKDFCKFLCAWGIYLEVESHSIINCKVLLDMMALIIVS